MIVFSVFSYEQPLDDLTILECGSEIKQQQQQQQQQNITL